MQEHIMAKGSNFRSAGTGRFITPGKAAKSPGTSLKEPRTVSGSSGEHYRSAGTGRYVTTKHGKANPGTTVKES